MRTIFLLGILATLVVIAVKKPDQTAVEAARSLGHQAEALFSQRVSPTEKKAAPEETVSRNSGNVTGDVSKKTRVEEQPPITVLPKKQASENGKSITPTVQNIKKKTQQQGNKITATGNLHSTRTAQPASVIKPDKPENTEPPIITVKPVTTHVPQTAYREIKGSAEEKSGKGVSSGPVIENYDEISSRLQNARRLLAEIK